MDSVKLHRPQVNEATSAFKTGLNIRPDWIWVVQELNCSKHFVLNYTILTCLWFYLQLWLIVPTSGTTHSLIVYCLSPLLYFRITSTSGSFLKTKEYVEPMHSVEWKFAGGKAPEVMRAGSWWTTAPSGKLWRLISEWHSPCFPEIFVTMESLVSTPLSYWLFLLSLSLFLLSVVTFQMNLLHPSLCLRHWFQGIQIKTWVRENE